MNTKTSPQSLIKYQRLGSELVRALRGNRTQTALGRRLGYRSNIVHRWESGQCWPTAAVFLSACARLRVDVESSFRRFYGRSPSWLQQLEVTSPGAVAAFLRDLRGRTPVVALAEASGLSRYSLSRWYTEQAQPRLPEYLCLIEASSRRLLDYLATLVEPSRLPSVAKSWTRLERSRQLAYESPWSHAVLRALELDAYQHGGYRDPTWLAQALGIEQRDVDDALSKLRDTGQIKKERGRWKPSKVISVNTGQDVERARLLKALWSREATERLARGEPGTFGYALFAVSRQDMLRLRDLQLEYVRAMQSIIAGSKGNECVGLYCSQLLDFRTGPDNALAVRSNENSLASIR